MRRLAPLALLALLTACGGAPEEVIVESDDLVCGDDICAAGETCLSCMADCGVCSEVDPLCGDGSCDDLTLDDVPTSPEPTAPDDPAEPDPPPAPGGDVAGDWPADWVALEQQVLDLVNEARQSGATCPSGPRPATQPLTWNAKLADAARLHSQDMADQGYFSHTSLDGRSPWQRMADAGYGASPTGENIAAGQGTAQGVFNSWMSSDGHCRNIMSGDSNEIGIGYAYNANTGMKHYWTQTFGRR